jgi:hypothetical protein
MVDAKKLLGSMILVVIVLFILYNILGSNLGKVSKQAESWIPGFTCPKNPSIDDYVKRMRSFAPSDSPISAPDYAIGIFWEYLECRSPAIGASKFTTKEISDNEPEILACANAAYINYKTALESKKKESRNQADINYYDAVMGNITKEYNVFNIIFPPSTYAGKVCNYAATGRSA